MTSELKSWLQQHSEKLCADTLYRAPNMLPDEQDVAEYLTVIIDNVGKAREQQLASIQTWALTTIGRDAVTAGDWLTILRVLKEEIVDHLSIHFSLDMASKYWREIDNLTIDAIIEAAQLTSYMGQAELLEHTVELREIILLRVSNK